MNCAVLSFIFKIISELVSHLAVRNQRRIQNIDTYIHVIIICQSIRSGREFKVYKNKNNPMTQRKKNKFRTKTQAGRKTLVFSPSFLKSPANLYTKNLIKTSKARKTPAHLPNKLLLTVKIRKLFFYACSCVVLPALPACYQHTFDTLYCLRHFKIFFSW